MSRKCLRNPRFHSLHLFLWYRISLGFFDQVIQQELAAASSAFSQLTRLLCSAPQMV
ncbi:MAG: hypothetical protein M3Z64_02740 [Verrucomicrobiota bacterium]|nr:hypothetical protein [Verrucomicrobiota bacterium]